jgi:hypothetical protein
MSSATSSSIGPGPGGVAAAVPSLDLLAQRQAKLSGVIREYSLDDEAHSTLAPLLKDVQVISCTTPAPGTQARGERELEAVVAFPTAKFEIKWMGGDSDRNSLIIRNLDNQQIMFEGSASHRQLYRGEGVYLVSIQPGVNELSGWLSAHGVDDCEQVDEPAWSVCPPYTVYRPDELDCQSAGRQNTHMRKLKVHPSGGSLSRS